MKINLSDLLVFEKLLNSLALDLREAWIHYKLFSDLNDSIPEYKRELNQSPAFWELTINSHLENSLFRLCRVYDQHKESLNLKNLLKAMLVQINREDSDENREENDSKFAFKNKLDEIDKNQLKFDIDFFVEKENEIVKKLVIWRNNKFAHQNVKTITGKIDIFQRYSMTYKELEILFRRGMEIVNRYSSLLFNSSFSINMSGQNDFKDVLESVRQRLSPI